MVVALRKTYLTHVRDELVCRTLKEKFLSAAVKMLVLDMEKLEEVWETLGSVQLTLRF